MPMHPQCRQRHVARNGMLNPAVSLFLPGTAMRARQEYLDEHYRPEAEAAERAERDRQFEQLAVQWYERMQQAKAAGLDFDEPLPDVPPRPEPWLDRKIIDAALWIDDLPVPRLVCNVLTILAIILFFWLLVPWFIGTTQREWKAMHRRDREYRGDAICPQCGKGFQAAQPAPSPRDA